MNTVPPILVMAIYISVSCALYLQYKGLGSLVAAVDRRKTIPTASERRKLIAGSIGYLCLSVFFGVMGMGEFVRVATEKIM